MAFVCSTAHAQTVSTGIVSGRVVDAVTEAPVPGVTVSVRRQTAQARSDSSGQFTLRGVRTGVVQLEARQLGYAPVVTSDVVVSIGKPVVVSIVMVQARVELQTVNVQPIAFPSQPPISTPTSSVRLTAEELRRTPGALEDVVQAIAIAPGVASTTGGRNDLFVRGGASFENLFIVDNLEVPNINHFGTQGTTGGPISLLNTRFVDNVNLSTGGFGVRYGDRVSSVTNVTLREGNRERIAGEINLAASQYGAIVEGPISRQASFLFNVRRSYLDLLFKALGVAFIPTYTDATFKATWRPSRRDVVSVLAVGAIDRVRFNNAKADDRVDNSKILGTSQDQYFAGLTWKRLFPSGVATTTVGRTWTRYRTAQFDSLEPPRAVFQANSSEAENSLRTDVVWQLSPRVEIDFGNIAKYADRLRYDVLVPGFARTDASGIARPLRADTTFTAFRNATYTQLSAQVTRDVRVTVGARGDFYSFLREHAVFAPRASATWLVNAPTTLTLSVGRFYQAPSLIWLVGDTVNPSALKPLRADQAVVALQRTIGAAWRWQLEGYVKRYANYPARIFRPSAVLQPSGFDDVTADIPFGLEPLSSAGRGRAFGVELLVQKKLDVVPVYGVASLTLSNTRFAGLNGRLTRGAFDAPIIANAVLGWRPSPKWEVSGRARTSTGLPVTPIISSGSRAGMIDFTRYNSTRLPFFFAVDGRIDRRWAIGQTQLITFLDVQNLTARANVSGYRRNPRTQMVENNAGLGVFPTIGVNWEF